MSKFVFVTGGVVSSIGKGITSSSIGALLKQCGLKIGAIKYNSEEIIKIIKSFKEEGLSSILVFPELALTGYTCDDLFLNSKTSRHAKTFQQWMSHVIWHHNFENWLNIKILNFLKNFHPIYGFPVQRFVILLTKP